MSHHRYAPEEIRADYIRVAAGLGLTVLPQFIIPFGSVLAWILAGGALLFLVFAFRTWLRQATGIEISRGGIARPGDGLLQLFARRVDWDDLRKLKVRYFSTKRDRSEGWMQMKIADSRNGLAVDSALDGFRDIAGLAADAAEARGLQLDGNTRANLAALGHRYENPPVEEGAAT